MKYLFLAFFSFSAFAANDASDLINPKEKTEFFNANRSQNLVNNSDALVGPKKALVKEGECVKFLKNGESYWNKYETEVSKVESVGQKSVKLRPILFLKRGLEDWTYSDDAKDLAFENQLKYEVFPCPAEKDRIPEDIAEILKKK